MLSHLASINLSLYRLKMLEQVNTIITNTRHKTYTGTLSFHQNFKL